MNIQEKVAEKIANCGSTVESTVVDTLAQAEINKRVDLITKSIGRLDNLVKEYNKINRDDLVTYSNGAKVSSMSEKRFQDIQKSKQMLEGFEKALNTALETNTQDAYNKLSEQLNKSNNVGGNQAESKPEGSTKA